MLAGDQWLMYVSRMAGTSSKKTDKSEAVGSKPVSKPSTGPSTAYRQAAVCGIVWYEHLEPLSQVEIDVSRISEALRRTGFALKSEHVLRDVRQGHELVNWLAKIFGTTPPGSIYFFHFCGHGMRANNRLILCLRDFDPYQRDMHTYTSILEEQIETLIHNATIVPKFAIVSFDACNEFLKSESFRVGELSIGTGKDPNDAAIYFLTGAKTGQKVRSVPGGGGHYSRALSAAIDPDNPPRTIYEVWSFTKSKVTEYCREHNHEVQEVELHAKPFKEEFMYLPIFDYAPPASASSNRDVQGHQSHSDAVADGYLRPPDPPFADLQDENDTTIRLCSDAGALLETAQDGTMKLRDEAKRLEQLSRIVEAILQHLQR